MKAEVLKYSYTSSIIMIGVLSYHHSNRSSYSCYKFKSGCLHRHVHHEPNVYSVVGIKPYNVAGCSNYQTGIRSKSRGIYKSFRADYTAGHKC